MREFIRELRRRNVVKVAVGYIVVAWLVMQAADVMFPALQLPPWSITLVAGLLIVGFPIALVLAWAFDLTPAGLARTDAAGSRPEIATRAAASNSVAVTAPSPAASLSLAVLPFADMSPARDQEYFADGLTEELLNALLRIPGLRVPSRTSSFALKGLGLDVSAVAARLHVTHVLEGSVRRADNRVRITAQLIETAGDSHLWSETYDRTLDDIFAIQSDIARKIVGALHLQLRPQDVAAATTQDAHAYELYLRGLGFYQRFGPRSLRFAIDLFRRATEVDPGFAKAWAGLSNAHATLATYYDGGTQALQASEEASRRSLELAPDLAEAHVARAMSFMAQQRHDEAAVEFERAVTLSPMSFDAWYRYARTAVHQGELNKALELFARASEVDPEDYQCPLIAAPLYRSLGDETRAVEAERRGVRLAERHVASYPDNARAYFLAAAALHNLGQSEKALEWADKALAIDPDDPTTRYNLACFHAQVGNADKALDLLEGSIASRSWVEHDPELDPIRDQPRFRAYVESLSD
jgi:adenylate cyclase